MDGQALFAGTSSGEVRLWSLARRQLVRCLQGLTEPVRALCQDPQGYVLGIAQSADHYEAGQYYAATHIGAWGTAKWDWKSWAVPAGRGNQVSTDGQWLAAGGDVGRVIHVWSLNDPTQTHRLSFPGGGVTDVTFSPDGRLLVAANFGGTVKVWKLPQFRECKQFLAHSRSVTALAFSRDSRRLAVAGEAGEAIKLWDVGTWQELIALPHERETLRGLFFTADGQQLIASNLRGEFFLWRVPSLAEIEALERKSTVH
jgi:WD40 repeat protein